MNLPAENPYAAPSPSVAAAPSGLLTRELPRALNDVPRDARVDETFGGFAGGVALASLFVLLAQLVAVVQGAELDKGRLEAIGISLGLASVCGAWEIVRRTRRTSLVFSVRGIGLYRRGQLEQVAAPAQLTWYKLSFINSIRELFLFGMFALFGGCGALAVGSSAASDGRIDLGFTFIIVGMAAGSVFALAGSIWSRWFCRHYIVPHGSTTETVALPKSALARLGVLRVDGLGMGL
jgi:hypothetical protein